MPSAVIRCPFPFPDIEATTQIKVYQEVDTKYEGKKEILVYDGLAVYDDTAKTVIGTDNKLVSLSGNIIVKGEIQTRHRYIPRICRDRRCKKDSAEPFKT
jgi:hypothetical protein